NADDEQDKRPKHERVERPREQVSRAVAVRTAGPKKIPAIDSDPDRPVDDQRKRNRHGGERKNVPCPPKAAAASEFPERDVQHLSDDDVERLRWVVLLVLLFIAAPARAGTRCDTQGPRGPVGLPDTILVKGACGTFAFHPDGVAELVHPRPWAPSWAPGALARADERTY